MRHLHLLWATLLLATPSLGGTQFLFGVDSSFANEMDDCGAIYRDNGKQQDVYEIYKAHDVNFVRLRLWVHPRWTKYSTLKDVKRSIARAKALHIGVLLDLHYSDDWADGDKQIIPDAWSSIPDDEGLAKTVYEYTQNVLAELRRDRLLPEMIQIGNETNGELMMSAPTKAAIRWSRNAKLLNAGIKAVRDSNPTIKIMLHIAQPENVALWLSDAAKAGVTDFDVIGISYYRKWSKLDLAGLGDTIGRLHKTYPKTDIMVVETAYPWTGRNADHAPNVLGDDSLLAGYPATVMGQQAYLKDIAATIAANGGAGLFYWAPDWLSTKCATRWGQGSNWDNAALFDFEGNALPSFDFQRPPNPW